MRIEDVVNSNTVIVHNDRKNTRFVAVVPKRYRGILLVGTDVYCKLYDKVMYVFPKGAKKCEKV